MRRRRVASRKPAKAPQRIKAKRSGASKAVRNRRPPALSKDTEVARLTRERDEAQKHLTEALEQQTTTSEILGIVARSPVDVQSVLICRSKADRLITFSTSAVGVCCWRDSERSSVRWCSSFSSRAFSMAMTA